MGINSQELRKTRLFRMKDDPASELNTKLLAVVLVVLLAGIGSWVMLGDNDEEDYEGGTAKAEGIPGSTSRSIRLADIATNGTKPVILVNQESRFYPLIATPLAVKYDQVGEDIADDWILGFRESVPLLVTGDQTATGIERFLELYSLPNQPEGIIIGDDGSVSMKSIMTFSGGSPEDISREIAFNFWEESDGVVIIRGDNSGYEQGVVGTVLASYLDIPVIVTDEKTMASDTADVLDDLGVKYSIVLGKASGYEKVIKFDSVEDIQDLVIKVVRERFGGDINYIALSNPLDSVEPEVLDSFSPDNEDYTGTITHSDAAAYPGAAPEVPNDVPELFFTIPDDYVYANVKIDIKMDVSMVLDADLTGERIYTYIGVDLDEDNEMEGDDDSPEDRVQFFGGSPAYQYIRENPSDPHSRPLTAHFYTELPFFLDQGPHAMQLLAKLPTAYSTDYSSTYTVHLEIEKLEAPNYPLIHDLSSLAPYLAAYRGGMVMAKPEYGIYEDVGYSGCESCGSPAANPDLLKASNEEATDVKHDLNRMLATLADLPMNYDVDFEEKTEQVVNLAQYYKDRNNAEDYFYLGIISDTNMVPHYYYYSSQGDPKEGYGVPGDNFYADIDSHEKDAPYSMDAGEPSMELAVGRIDGWDTQDVSALLARTFFYDDILDHYQGHRVEYNSGEIVDFSFKSSTMTSVGSLPPVEGAISVTGKLDNMFFESGFTSDSNRDQQQSRRQWQGAVPIVDSPDGAITAMNSYLETYEVYERSSFIMICAHGFYYWYVPTAQEALASPYWPETHGGGAFDVDHVKDMTLGPSVMFASSCVTGRVDGLQPYNTLSLAWLHGGMNAYIGASRMSWGMILPVPDDKADEAFGDYLAYLMYGYLTGGICYDKSSFQVRPEVEDVTTGAALMLAKNKYVEKMGTDGGGPNNDTLNEFLLHGDPAFNPYEPNHDG